MHGAAAGGAMAVLPEAAGDTGAAGVTAAAGAKGESVMAAAGVTAAVIMAAGGVTPAMAQVSRARRSAARSLARRSPIRIAVISIIPVTTRGGILSDTQRVLEPVIEPSRLERKLMTNQASRVKGMAIAFLLAASMMSPLPVSAGQHRDEAESAEADQKINPAPGEKACLHHIAQYDEQGNFVGYKTERGPCR
jgi:hypothetical protein